MNIFPRPVTFICHGIDDDGLSIYFTRKVDRVENGNIVLDEPANRAKDADYVRVVWFNLTLLPEEYDRTYVIDADGVTLTPISEIEREFLDEVSRQ